MKYAHIIHYFNSAPWAILPEKLHAILSLIELKAAGLTLTASEIDARIGAQDRQESVSPSSVAILPIHGTISNRIGMLERMSGGMSVESFTKDFRAAVNNPDIAAIVLDVDSPGGSTGGIEELANEIFAARDRKRIIASVNDLAASAAFWIASAAHEIALTPSGHVGSVGVLGVHMDFSAKAKAEGVAVTVVSAGKFKAEASEFSPMTGEARAAHQNIVDDRFDAFVRGVARGRKVSMKAVRNGFGEGRLVTAKEALAEGMVDSIETMDGVLSRTAGRASKARTIAEAASWEFGRIGNEGIVELGAAVMEKTATDMSSSTKGYVNQALIAPKTAWNSIDEARVWARDKNYRTDRVEESPTAWRLIQRDSGDFETLTHLTINSNPEMHMVCGVLKVGAPVAVDDLNVKAISQTLNDGIIPRDISLSIAPEGTTWRMPTLKDFTDKEWNALTDAEKRHIAMHAAWCKEMPPARFEDIEGFHHRPTDGAVVPSAVMFWSRSNTPALESKAHLEVHIKAIEARREAAMMNESLDPERVALELMELG